ncbi:hypothetical protein A6F68_00218 [Tsuneonella dongtanensis]|uniref:DUF1800 domain-containing protein n=1 Tax=Tsuneonella dongtanensis TaxID=692370 RepID=A0A1B2A999_9SPHN|nr:DUF1800 domain-containing protein [Tsuneonella dongtanensis]ANY18753.1 hypothetical protein A6F68_00218 [Tsuneonella dongtanensis]
MTGEKTIAYNRFGLGARPDDSLGGDPRGWAASQLSRFVASPPAIAAQPSRAELVTRFREYREQVQEERSRKREDAAMAPGMDAAMDSVQESENRPANIQRVNGLRMAYIGAVNARLASAVATDTPFAERLVHFWSNHFAISADKQPVVPLAGNYEFEAIRPHVMGNFHDMLVAAVLHPAMLLFLDQAQSVGPNSRIAQRGNRANGRQRGLNENLAREILELHTLGVRTGYSQADVTELARALTGWSLAGLRAGPLARLMPNAAPGETAFVEPLHEPGTRTILGKQYPDDGAEQALAVLRDLARSPSTARHVATKLARHFAADDPPPAMVARLEKAFLEGQGDLPTLYRALIDSPEAWNGDAAKFRNPWDWTVAALRASGSPQLPQQRAAPALFQQLGMPVWRPGSPAGFGDTAADWAGPGALMTRVEVAQQIANRRGNAVDPRAIAEAVAPDGLSPMTNQAIARAEQPSTGLALLFASPEFLRR